MSRFESRLDWTTLVIYLIFVFWGWVTIYAASVKNTDASIFNLQFNFGKQLIWMAIALTAGVVVLYTDSKLIEFLAPVVYVATVVLMVVTALFGKEINGAKAWLDLGSFRVQSSEFGKLGTALFLASFMSRYNFSLKNWRHRWTMFAIVALPFGLTLWQKDTGTALVFLSFLMVFYREGINPFYLFFLVAMGVSAILGLVTNPVLLVVGIALAATLSYYFLFNKKFLWVHAALATLFCATALGVDYVVDHVLKPHQRNRIYAALDPESDPQGVNWNSLQSKIAIGSGGFGGKGFLQGTQTKFEFVPQQDTDFIFCTIGEEFGWVGSAIFLILTFVFLSQLTTMAESSKTAFARIFGYGTVSILFFHFTVNIGMTIGLIPVIGIPLPFFSYGGSSLVSFTIMIFVMQNFYANRVNVLAPRR
ncbi:MAG: rod shape-determining protein RodA [Bacteroidia bacterium]|nr:rod shape-determining protein RodA [Bacteroidia bacterium]